MTRRKLYLASPLFSDLEREFNRDLKVKLSRYFSVFLPQEDGSLYCDLVANGSAIKETATMIFRKDLEAITASDVVLAVLDGRTVDEGVAFELGFAYALGKTCVGLQTDRRRLLPIGNNPMIDGPLRQTFESVDELLAWASAYCQRQHV